MATTQPSTGTQHRVQPNKRTEPALRARVMRVTSALVVATSHALRRLPLPQRYVPADLITSIVAATWPRRAIVRHNFAVVTGLPETDPRVRALARESVRNFGRMAIDFLAACTMDPAEVRSWVTPEGEPGFREAIARGHGVILAMPHMGSWDVGGAYAPAYGVQATAVVEGHTFEQIVEGARKYEGVTLVARDGSMRALFAALRRNEGVVLLSDVIHGAVQTVDVPFFGRPAPFPLGPARLAVRTGAALMVVCCVRETDRHYRILGLPPIWPELEPGETETAAVERLTALMAQGFEDVIRRYPGHWYPFHPIWAD